MQYQGSPDSFSSDPLSLSLSKFSYSVVPEDSNAPIPWIHLTSKGNLLAVFQNCRTWDYLGHPQDQSRFKVSNGTQTMEDIDLIALAASARKAVDKNQVVNVFNRPTAVAIIVKKPCVAIRYPSGMGQIRRFQIRFSHDADYYAAMGRFSQANTPVTEAGTFPTPQLQPRPYSSSSSALHLSDSVSQLSGHPSSTTSIVLPSRCSGSSKSSTFNEAEDFGRSGTSRFSMLQGPRRTLQCEETSVEDTRRHQAQGDVYALPQDATEGFRIPTEAGATTTLHPSKSPWFERPANSSSTIEGSQNINSTSSTPWLAPLGSSNHPTINLYRPRPSTAPVLQSQGPSDMLPPKRDLPFGKPISRLGPKSFKRTKETAKAVSPALAAAENDRLPAISPLRSCSQEAETQSASPKSKSKSKRIPVKKADTRVTKKPATSRSRKATTVHETGPVPIVKELLKRPQQTVKDVAEVSKAINTQALLAQVDECQAIRGLVDKQDLIRNLTQDAKAADQDTPTAPLALPQRMEQTMDMSRIEKPVPGARIVTAVSEAFDFREGNHSRSQAAAKLSPSPTPDRFGAGVNAPPLRKALSELAQNSASSYEESSVPHRANPSTIPLASLFHDPDFACSPNLAQWGQESEEKRRASLETFICRNIQDENFFKLCKDLDGTWQRIFLGKLV